MSQENVEIVRQVVDAANRRDADAFVATLSPDVEWEDALFWTEGATAHLAEPAETRALRGPKRRAKTDREDARWLRTLLAEGRLPEAWIPPAHISELRTRTRLRKTLVDERTAWLARIQATLFHHGVSGMPERLLSAGGREFLGGLELPEAARASGSRSRSR